MSIQEHPIGRIIYDEKRELFASLSRRMALWHYRVHLSVHLTLSRPFECPSRLSCPPKCPSKAGDCLSMTIRGGAGAPDRANNIRREARAVRLALATHGPLAYAKTQGLFQKPDKPFDRKNLVNNAFRNLTIPTYFLSRRMALWHMQKRKVPERERKKERAREREREREREKERESETHRARGSHSESGGEKQFQRKRPAAELNPRRCGVVALAFR